MEPDSSPALGPMLPAWAIVSPARREHIERVAELAGRWAQEMSVPDAERRRWLRAVWLHDALRDAPEDELRRWAPDAPGPVGLRHGPASAARAKAEGENDRGVLDAVRYHSIGLAEWDMAGRILYCADYLEPARKYAREWRAELAERLPAEPSLVLRQVARARVGHLVSWGRPLLEPTVRFWNSLVAESPGSD
jgi:HD superfamily phosphohydrolase YqeK